MTTALIPLDTLGATIRAHIEKGDASIEKAEQHYKSAGLHLAEAKARVKQTPGLTWPRFLLDHCQIRRARADELIMIADGRTTLADLRMRKAESVRATRERAEQRQKRDDSPLRSGEPVAAITEAVSSRDMYSDGDATVTYKRLHPMDPLNLPVEKLLPTDLCARAWAYQLAQLKPKGADEWSYHALCLAFARLSPSFRMKVLVDWFRSLSEPDQLVFHESCPHPNSPEYMGDWLVDALIASVKYRPEEPVTDEMKREMAFAEMDKAIEIYRSWSPEHQRQFEERHSQIPDVVPSFLRTS